MTNSAKLRLFEVEVESPESALCVNRCIKGKVAVGDVVCSGVKADGTIVLIDRLWIVGQIRFVRNIEIDSATAWLGTQIRFVGDGVSRIAQLEYVNTESPAGESDSGLAAGETPPVSALKEGRRVIDRQIVAALGVVVGSGIIWSDEGLGRLCAELGWHVGRRRNNGAIAYTDLDLAVPVVSWWGSGGAVNYMSISSIDPISEINTATVEYLCDSYVDLVDGITAAIGPPAITIAGVHGEVRWVFPDVVIRLCIKTHWFDVMVANPVYQALHEGKF